MVVLWNRVDDLEDGRIIGVAKPLRNGPLQHRPDPFQTTRRQFVTGGFLQEEFHVLQEMTCGKVRVLIVPRQESRQFLLERRGEQGALPQDRHEGVYGNTRPLDQSKAQGESRYFCSNQLIEGELQGRGFPDRTGQTRLPTQRTEQRTLLDKLFFGTADHDEECSGLYFGKAPQHRRLAI